MTHFSAADFRAVTAAALLLAAGSAAFGEGGAFEPTPGDAGSPPARESQTRVSPDQGRPCGRGGISGGTRARIADRTFSATDRASMASGRLGQNSLSYRSLTA